MARETTLWGRPRLVRAVFLSYLILSLLSVADVRMLETLLFGLARNVHLESLRRAWSGASLGWRRSTGSRRATPIYRTVIKLGSRQAHSARFIGPTFGTFIRPIPSISRTRQTNHRKGRRDTHPAAPSFPHCPVRAHPCSRGGRRRPEPPHLLHGAAQWTCSRARLLCLDAAGAAR